MLLEIGSRSNKTGFKNILFRLTFMSQTNLKKERRDDFYFTSEVCVTSLSLYVKYLLVLDEDVERTRRTLS